MENVQDRSLDAARELLQELERPNPYVVLGATREMPESGLQRAFTTALAQSSQTHQLPATIADARKHLINLSKRLEWDARFLDRSEWLRSLEELRNRYALFDFVADLRRP